MSESIAHPHRINSKNNKMDYTKAMTAYFGMYAVTMVYDVDLFWGPESIMMLPYSAQTLDEAAMFFARLVGFLFGVLAISFVSFGSSRATFTKQTLCFHIGTLPFMAKNAMSEDAFTPWVWQLQMALGLALGVWGFSTLDSVKKGN